ncbi:MAG TPA: DUF58 domain-containing protein [Actinomycetaceae bacterium]|nr:DUF58 domain-containing protein [Actinomycetaceae bacterium]
MFVTGRAVVAAAMGGVVVVLMPSWATAWNWLALVTLLIALDVVIAAPPRDVVVTRTTTPVVRLGETGRSTLVLHAPGRRGLRGVVRDAWTPTAGAAANRHRIRIPAGEQRRVSTALLPIRRGERAADLVTIRSEGPLRLAGRQASLEVPGSILVLPPFHSRRHLPSRLAMLREMDGRSAVMTRGQGTEFDSLREYVIGDDVRAIDWRATARARDVMVRTWRPERDRRVFVVVDSGRLSAVRLGEETRLDAQMEAALLLAALASHAGDRVQVVAVDTEVRARTVGKTGPALMNSLAEDLAVVEPEIAETNWTLVATTVRQSLSQRSLVVLLTALDSSTLQGGLLQVAGTLASDHTVVLASASDEVESELRADVSDTSAAFIAAAAERSLLEREAAGLRLRQRGVEVVEATAPELAVAVADTYLRLKRAGRL